MQARWHLLVVVFILANISLKAQDNGGCNDCPAFNASGKIGGAWSKREDYR